MHQVIQHGILALSEKLRAAFVLFYKEELSLDEVAASLDLPVGTVKSRLHEAREQFKATLERQGVRYE
jgi:RNA polymerase sigma-70 factor (ECF subfamily)